MHWACFTAAENSFKFLLSWMNDINIVDKRGYTPLHISIFSERVRIIKKLIHKGSDLNAKDFTGRTALDIAKENNLTNIVRMLSINDGTILSFIHNHFFIQKSNSVFYAILFVTLHLLFSSLVFFYLLPFFNSTFLYFSYLLSLFIVFSVYFFMIFYQTGITSNNNKTLLELVEKNININEYCPYCIVILFSFFLGL